MGYEKIPEVGALKLQKTLEKTHNSHLKKKSGTQVCRKFNSD